MVYNKKESKAISEGKTTSRPIFAFCSERATQAKAFVHSLATSEFTERYAVLNYLSTQLRCALLSALLSILLI